ncbi:MAG: hypothetical protein ABIH11_06300 [Candidatus Altiarchaeota archaeon]
MAKTRETGGELADLRRQMYELQRVPTQITGTVQEHIMNDRWDQAAGGLIREPEAFGDKDKALNDAVVCLALLRVATPAAEQKAWDLMAKGTLQHADDQKLRFRAYEDKVDEFARTPARIREEAARLKREYPVKKQ